MLMAAVLASTLLAAPATAANLGATLPLGRTMHTGDYILAGHWELVLDNGGNLIGIKTTTGQHCYAWGPAGANAFASFDGVSHHFYIKRSDGSLFKDFGSGGTGTNVSIYNGNFYVGNTFIHGPAPACTA
jgi:hypothetical protein